MSEESTPPPPSKVSGEGPTVDFIAATVTLLDGTTVQFENIDNWTSDGDRQLQIVRRGLPVAVYAQGMWTGIALTYRLTDGSTINQDGDTGPPTEVGMGVTVAAVGGRTA